MALLKLKENLPRISQKFNNVYPYNIQKLPCNKKKFIRSNLKVSSRRDWNNFGPVC